MEGWTALERGESDGTSAEGMEGVARQLLDVPAVRGVLFQATGGRRLFASGEFETDEVSCSSCQRPADAPSHLQALPVDAV